MKKTKDAIECKYRTGNAETPAPPWDARKTAALALLVEMAWPGATPRRAGRPGYAVAGKATPRAALEQQARAAIVAAFKTMTVSEDVLRAYPDPPTMALEVKEAEGPAAAFVDDLREMGLWR